MKHFKTFRPQSIPFHVGASSEHDITYSIRWSALEPGVAHLAERVYHYIPISILLFLPHYYLLSLSNKAENSEKNNPTNYLFANSTESMPIKDIFYIYINMSLSILVPIIFLPHHVLKQYGDVKTSEVRQN